MAFDSGSRITSGSGSITVPTLTNGVFVAIATQEYTTAPVTSSVTLGGTSLGTALAVQAPLGGEGAWLFFANQATITSIGTGTKTLASSLTGGTGGQGNQIVWAFFSGRSQTTPSGGGILSATGTSTTPSLTYNPVGSNADVMIGFASNTATTITATTPFTLISAGSDGGGDAAAAGAYLAATSAGSATGAFASSQNQLWSALGLVLEAAGGGGGGSIILPRPGLAGGVSDLTGGIG